MSFWETIKNGFSNRYYNEVMATSQKHMKHRKQQKSIGLRQLFEDMALFLTVCTAILFVTVFKLTDNFQSLIFIMICVSAALFCIGRLMKYDTKKEEKLKKGIDSFVAWRNNVRSKVNR